ncbi:MAG: rhodanese-like domain-containing protein [Verrucomicrobiia bacterium]|jgi:rhodanese-related sulfurtransferase
MKALHHFQSLLVLGFILSVSSTFAADKKAVHQRVSVTEFERILKEKKLTVLDVRTPAEYDDGHIKGAKLINFYAADFAKQVGKLDKKKEYLVTCRSGGRSARACQLMTKLGFKKLYDLSTGMSGWVAAGKPVTQ